MKDIEDLRVAIGAALAELAGFVQLLPAGVYAAPMSELVEATIGQHVRHCLDHFAALARGLDAGRIDYDARQRNTALERDAVAAAGVANDLAAALPALLADVATDTPVLVRAAAATHGAVPWLASTLGRELQFVASHTVHHLAMMAAVCRRRGIGLPDAFGVAPSTLRHRNATEAGA